MRSQTYTHTMSYLRQPVVMFYKCLVIKLFCIYFSLWFIQTNTNTVLKIVGTRNQKFRMLIIKIGLFLFNSIFPFRSLFISFKFTLLEICCCQKSISLFISLELLYLIFMALFLPLLVSLTISLSLSNTHRHQSSGPRNQLSRMFILPKAPWD